jgi:hypothetical protein
MPYPDPNWLVTAGLCRLNEAERPKVSVVQIGNLPLAVANNGQLQQ